MKPIPLENRWVNIGVAANMLGMSAGHIKNCISKKREPFQTKIKPTKAESSKTWRFDLIEIHKHLLKNKRG